MHQDLHSFPTRRSSDLGDPGRRPGVRPAGPSPADGADRAGRGEGGVRLAVPDRDRKSTRLNSSHSQISYAVFCLKKKKASTPAPKLVSAHVWTPFIVNP